MFLIGKFFNLYLYNILLEFLFAMLSQQFDLSFLHDFLINSRHSDKKYCFYNCTLGGTTITVDPRIG